MLYPAFLRIDGWKCLVVGGGEVAFRKIETLLACQAVVEVSAPEVIPALKILAGEKKISLSLRRFEISDLDHQKLVICATDDRKLNREIANSAKKKGLLVNVVNDEEEGNYLVPSTLRRGPLSIAVSTDGVSPALAKKIREDLEKEFGPEYDLFLELMEKYRQKVLQSVANEEERKKLFSELAHSEILNEIRSGKPREKIELLMKEIFQKYLTHANR